MNEMTPSPGHNNPPNDRSLFLESVENGSKFKELNNRIIELRVAARRVPEGLDGDTEELATSFVSQCKLALKDATALKGDLKRPFLDRNNWIEDRFKTLAGKLQELIDPVEKQLVALAADKKRKAEAEAKEIADKKVATVAELNGQITEKDAEADRLAKEGSREDAVRAEIEADDLRERVKALDGQPVQKVQEVRRQATTRGTYGGSVVNTKRWTFEVIDAAKVPREYLMVDEQKIRAAVDVSQVREIPGVRIYQTEGGHVRA